MVSAAASAVEGSFTSPPQQHAVIKGDGRNPRVKAHVAKFARQ
jgi:hypothetical protein